MRAVTALLWPSLRAASNGLRELPFDGVALLIVTGRTGFGRGVPLRVCAGPSRGAWKIFRKKDRLYSVAFFADRMRKRNPYPVFPSIVSLRSTFSLHSVPGSAAVCGTGSVRTRYFCYICSRRRHLLAGGTGRLLIVSSLITLGV